MSPSPPVTLKVYKSSAGSGKTTRLVFEYLRLVLPFPDHYSRILAVTFTNKAANEMKERIIQYLHGLASPGSGGATLPPDMEASLHEMMEAQGKDTHKQATICLNKILHSYSDFAVSTIDSFVHRIIRSFAKDLGLSWDFEVEMDVEKIFGEIIDLLMEEYGEDALVTRQINELMQDKLNDNKSWRLESDILHLASKLLGSDTPPRHLEEILNTPGEDYEVLRKSLKATNKKLLSQARATAEKAVSLMESHHIDPMDLAYKKNGLGGYLNTIARKNAEKVMEESSRGKNAAQSGCLYPKSNKDKALISRIEGITPQIIGFFDELEEIRANSQAYFSREAVVQNLHVMAIIKTIYSIWEEVKQEHSVLPISEFDRSIAQITLHEDIPYIYERLGERYRHFFIDEFQDTATLQWENMLPLMEHALSAGHFNLLVGDVKQAIYRFRGGNIELLGKMPQPPDSITSTKSVARYRLLQEGTQLEQLDTNYRSREEIVTFNNHFFSYVHSCLPAGQKPFYDDVEQKEHRKPGGQVNISVRPREDHAERTLEIIESLLDQGYAQRDIAILCRKNSQARSMAVYLLGCSAEANSPHQPKRQLNVISDESLTLKQSPQINALTAIARLQANPDNKVIIANISHYLFRESGSEKDFDTWLRDNGGMPGGTEDLVIMAQKMGYTLPITSLWKNQLYQFFEMLAKALKMNYLNDPYLRFFMDDVLLFSHNNTAAGLHGFLHYWERSGQFKSIISPTGMNAILIKTIHKSKGLAFPVVIYPYADEKADAQNNKNPAYKWVDLSPLGLSKPSTSIVSLKKSLLEKSLFHQTLDNEMLARQLDMINLLYVCLTRPRERMYIITNQLKDSKEKEQALKAPLKSVTHLLHAYLNSQESEDISDYCFPRDMPPEKPQASKTEDPPPPLAYQALANWQKKLFIRSQNHPAPTEPQSKGQMLHHYLALITEAEEMENILERIGREVTPRERSQKLQSTIRQIVNHPHIQQYFLVAEDHTVKTECEMITPAGVIRPDRVSIMPQQVVVIDYKTGKTDPSHKVQVEEYAKSLESIYQRPVKTILVYDHDPITVVTNPQ